MTALRLSSRKLEHLLGEWRAGAVAYRELADAIRLLILDRRIAPGTVLPSERDLAARVHLSRTTVAAAYGALRDTGVITSIRGSGSVVRSPRRTASWSRAEEADGIDLSQASPPAWAGLPAVFAEAAETASAILSRPGYDVVGSFRLRRAVAERYTELGLPTEPEQIMVTQGAQSAIAIVAQTLLRRGERVVLETPTYPHAAELFRHVGAQAVALPVDPDDGWDADLADRVFRRTVPAAAYLMPDFQNPTGASMAAKDRFGILRAASESGTILIADETTAELAADPEHRHRPLGAGEDPALRRGLITIGSLGKTVWGGLRVGWIRAEHDVISRLVSARPIHDLGTPEFEQEVALRCLERMPEIVVDRSRQLREGRDALVAKLGSLIPEWRIPRPAGGVAVWVGLGEPVSSPLVLAARERGVILSSGPRFGVDGGHERHLRVPFTASVLQLENAASALVDAWHEVRDRGWTKRAPDLAVV